MVTYSIWGRVGFISFPVDDAGYQHRQSLGFWYTSKISHRVSWNVLTSSLNLGSNNKAQLASPKRTTIFMYSPRFAHFTSFFAHWENLIEGDEFKVGPVDVTQPHGETCAFALFQASRWRGILRLKLPGDGILLWCADGRVKTASISKTILQYDRTAPTTVSFWTDKYSYHYLF